MGALLVDLGQFAGQRLQIIHPFVALVARLGDQNEQHLGLNLRQGSRRLERHGRFVQGRGRGRRRSGHERLVLNDDDQVKVALLVHGSKVIYTIERNDGREDLFGLVDRVDERTQRVDAFGRLGGRGVRVGVVEAVVVVGRRGRGRGRVAFEKDEYVLE